MKSYAWKFVVIAVLTAGFIAPWAAFGITLGTDLQGGSVLVYQLDFSKLPARQRTAETTDATIEILSRRLDALQIQEMELRRAGDDQIIIRLPGESEQRKEQIKRVIATAGNLWFKIVVQPGDPEYSEKTIREIEERKARGEYLVEDEEFDTARDRENPAYIYLLRNEDAVDGNLLAHAEPGRDEIVRQEVAFEMKPEGRQALARTTEKWRGHQMAIVLDGVVQSAPRINTPITDGAGVIEGRFKKEEIQSLVTVLRSGALPAKPILESEDSIAPTLGEEAIRRGMTAVVGGLAIILVFMVVFYGISGLIANIALILNLVLLLGILALFEATLTLPGIVGMLLTIGMAVDANILINERMREERERGLPMHEVIDAGYKHAFSAIFDSNLTTILTGVILYVIGTGPIKGFAVTLIIGIAVSMFTALWVTRAFFQLFIDRGWIKDIRYLKILQNANFPFIRKRAPLVLLALIFMNVGYALFAVRGESKFGIDFNGGSLVQMRVVEPLSVEQVKERLQAKTAVVGGETVRPYAGVEVQAVGARDAATGGYRAFQLLLTSGTSGGGDARTARAEERPSAAASATPTATAAASDDDADAPAPAARDVVVDSPQQRFMQDIEALFAKELVPQPFSALAVENVVGKNGVVRLSIEARLDPEEMAKPEVAQRVDVEAVKRRLANAGYADAEVTREGNALRVRTGEIDITKATVESHDAAIKTALLESLPANALSNPFPFKTSIGASVAHNLKSRAMLSIILSLIMMIVYIAFRFEFKAGFAATLCLFHDVAATLGVMMILDLTSHWTGLDTKINLGTIAAFLTIVGFSINDTIVTFDRVRENLAAKKPKDRKEYEDLLERSVNQVLPRSVLTAATVFAVLIVLAFAGVQSLMGFTLALLAGVTFGSYSTIALAAPIMLVEPRRLATFIGIELAAFIALGVVGGYLGL